MAKPVTPIIPPLETILPEPEYVQPGKRHWTPRAKGSGVGAYPPFNQASRIIDKFGGEKVLAEALNIGLATVYRWTYKAPYGTNGLIPSSNWLPIAKVARLMGVLLTEEDWLPYRELMPNEKPDVPDTVPLHSLLHLPLEG